MSSSVELASFIEWTKANGAVIDERLEFKVTQASGIACFTKEEIKIQEDPLIYVPKDMLVTLELAEKYFVKSASDIELSSKNPNALTQLFLAQLKFGDAKEREFFIPYMSLLSIELDQPYFWSLEVLNLIEGTDLYLVLKKNISRIANEWLELLEQLEIINEDSEEIRNKDAAELLNFISSYRISNCESIQWNGFFAYLWSTCIFSSRAFPQLLIGSKNSKNLNQGFLYPIVDLLNHKNDTNVRWDFQDDKVCFKALDFIKSGTEIFNNYGNKPNEELLLSYGFVEEHNFHDTSRLTLKLDSQMIITAQKSGVNLTKSELIKSDCVQFELALKSNIPKNLINLFGYLSKLRSEESITIRSLLVGSDELSSILNQKVEFFKKALKFDQSTLKNSNINSVQSVKKFLTSQRKIYTRNLESLQKVQKIIIKESEESVSFKNIFKSDKTFANSTLLTFGVTNFEDLILKNCMKNALLLWIVRIANCDEYPKKFDFSYPKFILTVFEEVSSTIVIEKDDVMDYMEFYKFLFPKISDKIPEVYKQGNWGIKQFIVADTVLDRLVWTRKVTEETIFLKRQEFKL